MGTIQLGTTMVIYLIIALLAIGLIFSPAVTRYYLGEKEVYLNQSHTMSIGLLARVDAWKTYPNYNIGLAVISVLAFGGAIYAGNCMFKAQDRKNDAL